MCSIEQRAIIKYLVKKGLDYKAVHQELLEVYGNEAPSRSTVHVWCREFKCGRTSLEDDPRSGRPSTSSDQEHVSAVEALIMENRRITTRMIAATLSISKGTVQTILHERLQMSKVCARWVPKCLSAFDKARRVEVSKELLHRYNCDPANFETRLITGDETWIHCYQPETKQQSQVWKHRDSPPPVKFKTCDSAAKVLASIFWDSEGVLLVDFLHKGSTVTGAYYSQLLRALRDAIKQKRRGKLTRGVLLLQDNAPAHTSQVAVVAASDCGFELVPHPLTRLTWLQAISISSRI